VAAWLEEVAAHPELFKLAGGADHALSRADALARNYLSSRERHFSNWFRQYAGALVLLAVANTALLAGGAWLVLERQLTLGQLVAAEFIVASVLLGFSKLAEKLETFYDLLAAVDKLGQLVDLPVESASSESDPHQEHALGLSLKGVCAQPLEPGTSLSLELAPGDEIAVVGGEASGKSVLADLMVGLRPVRKGTLYYDGVDRRDVDLERLRDHVVLLRRADMVSGSLSDNVRFGRTEVSVQDVRDALARVGLTQTVERLPQGLRTPVNPRGAPLASGERIRLAVARALVGSPRLIVVDGMLDGLDPALQTPCSAPCTGRACPGPSFSSPPTPPWPDGCRRLRCCSSTASCPPWPDPPPAPVPSRPSTRGAPCPSPLPIRLPRTRHVATRPVVVRCRPSGRGRSCAPAPGVRSAPRAGPWCPPASSPRACWPCSWRSRWSRGSRPPPAPAR